MMSDDWWARKLGSAAPAPVAPATPPVTPAPMNLPVAPYPPTTPATPPPPVKEGTLSSVLSNDPAYTAAYAHKRAKQQQREMSQPEGGVCPSCSGTNYLKRGAGRQVCWDCGYPTVQGPG